MSRIVELPSGEKVHFKERLTHKAMKAYNEAMNKGRVVKEYDDESGESRRVVETPAVNSDAAVEAALVVMIEKVVEGDVDKTATPAWLDGLAEEDYLKVVEEFNTLIREMTRRTAAGKKNG